VSLSVACHIPQFMSQIQLNVLKLKHVLHRVSSEKTIVLLLLTLSMQRQVSIQFLNSSTLP